MKNFAKFVFFIIFSSPLLAQTASINGFCNQGASQAQTSGLPSSNYLQGVIPDCTVTVYLTGTTNLATIYADGNSTPLSNPFTANSVGAWVFYAAINQGYDIIGSGGLPPNIYSAPTPLCIGCYAGSNISVTPGVVVNACSYPGTDLGARIQAADNAWAGISVELDVSQTCPTTETTTFTLTANHNLKFVQGGLYTMLAGNVLSNNDVVSGIGPQVELKLAANQLGGMFQFVNGANAASYVTITSFTMDGNQANAPASCSSSTYNCAFGAYINSSSTQAPNHIVFDSMIFQNFYGFPIWIYEGSVGYPEASYIWIEHSKFTNMKKEAIRSYGDAGHIRIIDNDFTNYGNLGGGNWDAIYWADVLASSCSGITSLTQDWMIQQNRFYNTAGETKFSVEMYGGTMSCSIVDGFSFTNNAFDGEGYGGGTGLSAGSMHAVISNNTWKNCTASSDRCGIESWTAHSTISGNTMDEGAIQIYPSSAPTTFTDVTVVGNTINNAQDNGSGSPPILLTTGSSGSGVVTNVNIVGNTIDFTGSACTNSDAGISVGASVSGGAMSQVNISNNNVYACNGAGANGIRVTTVSGATTKTVTIDSNNIFGAGSSSQNGILDSDADTRDSDIRLHGNHIVSFTTPINISLPSAQWDAWGNDTSATSQGFNTQNGYQAQGLPIISPSGVIYPQISSPWVPYNRNTLSADSALTFGLWSPSVAEIVTQVEYSLEIAPLTCTTAPLVEVFDKTLNSVVAGTTVTVSGSTGSSGLISVPLVISHIYAAELSANGGTCLTEPADPQLTVQLRNVGQTPIATRSAYYSGATTATNFGSFVGSGETVTQIDISPQVAPLTCSPFPTVELYDFTASSVLATVTLASGSTHDTSGPISATVPLGDEAGWVFTQGTGCGTNAVGPMVTAQFSGGYETVNSYARLIPSAGTVTFGSFTPQQNLFVAGIGVSLETSAAGCSPSPVVQVYDNTTSSSVSGLTATIANSTPQTWVSNLAGYLIAGHQYQFQITKGTGCSTEPANPDVSLQYNVNTGILQVNNNLSDVQSVVQALINLGATSSATTPVINTIACIKTVGPPVVLGYCATAPSGGPPETCTCN